MGILLGSLTPTVLYLIVVCVWLLLQVFTWDTERQSSPGQKRDQTRVKASKESAREQRESDIQKAVKRRGSKHRESDS